MRNENFVGNFIVRIIHDLIGWFDGQPKIHKTRPVSATATKQTIKSSVQFSEYGIVSVNGFHFDSKQVDYTSSVWKWNQTTPKSIFQFHEQDNVDQHDLRSSRTECTQSVKNHVFWDRPKDGCHLSHTNSHTQTNHFTCPHTISAINYSD